MFQVTVRVANPAGPERNFQERFWVDTGALYTFVPENRLLGIGLKPLRSRDLILVDGRRDRRLLGEALLTLPELGETLTCPVVFAPAGSLYLLGATALENFGVQADPAEQRLKPIAAIVGGFLGSRPRSSRQSLPSSRPQGEFLHRLETLKNQNDSFRNGRSRHNVPTSKPTVLAITHSFLKEGLRSPLSTPPM